VGSLWEVEDIRTREVITGFHDAYRASGDAASALRAAQLSLLRGPDRSQRSPAAWAGFRYAGR
jgi:CHAT domain-containing protein